MSHTDCSMVCEGNLQRHLKNAFIQHETVCMAHFQVQYLQSPIEYSETVGHKVIIYFAKKIKSMKKHNFNTAALIQPLHALLPEVLVPLQFIIVFLLSSFLILQKRSFETFLGLVPAPNICKAINFLAFRTIFNLPQRPQLSLKS